MERPQMVFNFLWDDKVGLAIREGAHKSAGLRVEEDVWIVGRVARVPEARGQQIALLIFSPRTLIGLFDSVPINLSFRSGDCLREEVLGSVHPDTVRARKYR